MCLNVSLQHKNNSFCLISPFFYFFFFFFYFVNKISPLYNVLFVGVDKPCSFFLSNNIRSTPQTYNFVTIRTSENNVLVVQKYAQAHSTALLFFSFYVTGWLLEPAVSFEKAVMIFYYKQHSCLSYESSVFRIPLLMPCSWVGNRIVIIFVQ